MVSCKPCPFSDNMMRKLIKDSRINATIRLVDGKGGLAYQLAERLIFQQVCDAYERRGWQVFSEYGYAGNMESGFSEKKISYADSLSSEIHDIREIFGETARKNKWWRRKPDIMMIHPNGEEIEFLEVGTDYGAKKLEVDARIFDFNALIEAHGISGHGGWFFRPSKWRPRCRGIIGEINGKGICVEPTWRDGNSVPDGVILYEVHDLTRQKQPLPVPAVFPVTASESELRQVAIKIERQYPLLAREVAREVSRNKISSLLGMVLLVVAAILLWEFALPVAVAAAFALLIVRNNAHLSPVGIVRLTQIEVERAHTAIA